jgi:hypothetical protein
VQPRRLGVLDKLGRQADDADGGQRPNVVVFFAVVASPFPAGYSLNQARCVLYRDLCP